METRPELILLQKSMVIVEGVARNLDPDLNIWVAAEPVAREWMEHNLGLAGRLREAGTGAGEIAKVLGSLPELMQQMQRSFAQADEQARSGVRLDAATLAGLSQPQASSGTRLSRLALWIAALSLAAIAAAMWR